MILEYLDNKDNEVYQMIFHPLNFSDTYYLLNDFFLVYYPLSHLLKIKN